MKPEKKIRVIEPLAVRVSQEFTAVPDKLRVAAYARVSTEQDEQQSSYEAQVSFYTSYIQANPAWEFVKVFADEGITGTNMKKRDGFNEMITRAENGEIDLILTKSISRFARNTVDTLQTVRDLKAVGVEVIFEKENLHTFDPKCEVMLTIMSSLAQEESRSISENVKWGVQKSMRDGKVNIPYKSFLGYQKGPDGRPEIVEEEAAVVRSIYDMYLDGKTFRCIANYLTEQGIPTPKGRRVWSVSTVRSILSNEKYKGDAILQKTYTVDYLTKEKRKNEGELKQYVVENSHDPIVDAETFERVQAEMAHRFNRKDWSGSSHPFANCFVCAECGGFFGHKVWHNRHNTERYNVWYCNRRYNGGRTCETPILRENEIMEAFAEVLKRRGVADPTYSEECWRTLVECVKVYPNRRLRFVLKEGVDIEVRI